MEPSYLDIRRFRSEVPHNFSEYPTVVGRDKLIAQRLGQCHSVLEIGSGDRPFFSGAVPHTYRLMDVDRSLSIDFYSIEEVCGTYDAVLMREVVEHLPRELFYRYLEKIFSILNWGGALILTTPNTWSPGWMLSDYSHVSPWPMHDMYGVLRCHGFSSVEIYRILWPSRALWLKRLYWAVHSKFYALDHAGSYVAVATKME